jgi:fatty acid/phospholipid biosynthesis enzyme
MKIKLTKTQLEGIHTLIRVMLRDAACEEMADKLLYEIVDGISDKITKRMKKLQYENNGGYGLSLSSIEAKALYCWLTNQIHIYDAAYQYESIVATGIIGEIDQEYA